MRTIVLVVLLLVVGPARAEWVLMTETHEMRAYLDPSTIRENGHLRRVWKIFDMKQQQNGALSMRVLQEYDCKEERSRRLRLTAHSEGMAAGKLVFSQNEPDGWRYIAPRTAGAFDLKFVCSR